MYYDLYTDARAENTQGVDLHGPDGIFVDRFSTLFEAVDVGCGLHRLRPLPDIPGIPLEDLWIVKRSERGMELGRIFFEDAQGRPELVADGPALQAELQRFLKSGAWSRIVSTGERK